MMVELYAEQAIPANAFENNRADRTVWRINQQIFTVVSYPKRIISWFDIIVLDWSIIIVY